MAVAAREKAGDSAAPRLIDGAGRIGRTLLITGIVLASLLTFPVAIPWMVAFWLLWHALLVLRGRPGWLPLAACAALLAIKGVDWQPALLALVALMLAVCVARRFWNEPHRAAGKPVTWIGVLSLAVAWTAMTLQWQRSAHCGRHPVLQPTRPVACIGDSLTAFGYPKCLKEMLSIPVADLSFDGITTADAVRRLPSLIKANPQVVVIELGGHDFLRGYSRAATKENLEKIIGACQGIGAEVVLMEIPRGFMTDPFDALDRELARRRARHDHGEVAIGVPVLRPPAALLGDGGVNDQLPVYGKHSGIYRILGQVAFGYLSLPSGPRDRVTTRT